MNGDGPMRDELVCQRSSPLTVAGLLGGIMVFMVPPFQRDYAWDDDAIDLFIGDVDRCRRRRLIDNPEPHFFGAIVTSPEIGAGTARPHSMLIDGQQRLATVFLYLTRLRRRFEKAAERADSDELQKAFSARSAEIKQSFEWINDLEFRKPLARRRLNLNRVDDPFFKLILDGADPAPSRASHERILTADTKIEEYFDRLLERRVSSEDDERILNSLYASFLRDWEIVHISARTRRQANTIYRVLNSRGVPVSDCDLLRAATLERVEAAVTEAEVQSLSESWDDILGLGVETPDVCLDLAFQGRTGERRPKDRTATSFESSYFEVLAADEQLTQGEAGLVIRQVTELRDDCVKAAGMLQGDTGRGAGNPLTPVMNERFRALTELFRQDYCIPLLLAGSSLPNALFLQLVNVLDRFAYRYGVMVGAPIGPFERLTKDYILALRDRPDVLDIQALTEGLQELLDTYATLAVFAQRLRSLRHGAGQNAEIRYLLAMIEWMDVWFTNGAQGAPRTGDETRGIDLRIVTLEHISASEAPDTTPEVQPLLDTVGNLTLLSEGDNNAAGNKPFAEKMPIYERSNFAINRALAADRADTWGVVEVTGRQDELIVRSEAIFTLIRR